MRNSNLTQLMTVSSGSGLSVEQDTILRNTAKEETLTKGVSKIAGMQIIQMFS